MDKDLKFFSTDGKGLTATSANHVANLAKEMVRELEATLQQMSFYNTTVTLIGSNQTNVLSKGVENSDVELVIDRLNQIAKAKSLIAWLREAIKAKDRLLKATLNMSVSEYEKKLGLEPIKPLDNGMYLTEEKYWAEKSVNEYCRYYLTETLAATLGDSVHPGGSIADARKELHYKSANPHDVMGKGRDMVIYNYEPTADEAVVERIYFRLQNQYREAQSILNAMKHECKRAVGESDVRKMVDERQYKAEREKREKERDEYVVRTANKLNELRIVIPVALKEVYETVSHLGKQ